MKHIKFYCFVLMMLLGNWSYAQDTHPTNSIRADLSIPDSPVSEILGTSTKAVVPSTGRELGLGLIKSLDTNGKLKDGIHFEFSPSKVFASKEVVSKHSTPGAWESLKVGIATAKGSGYSDEGQRIAAGFHLNLIDQGAPSADTMLTGCLVYMEALHITNAERSVFRNARTANETSKPIIMKELEDLVNGTARVRNAQDSSLGGFGMLDRFENEIRFVKENNSTKGGKAALTGAGTESYFLNRLHEVDVALPSFAKSIYAETCRKRSEARNWNRTRLMIGAAQSWASLDSEKSSFRSAKQGLWTTFAYGFEKYLEDASKKADPDNKETPGNLLARYTQLVLHGQYLRKDVVANSTVSGGKYERNMSILGVGIRFGQPDMNAIIGGRAERSSSNAKGKESAKTLSIQAEKRLTTDLWLNVSIEGKGSLSTTGNKPFAFAGVKWGSSSGATLAP